MLSEELSRCLATKAVLDKYQRSVILEIYFSRLDGRATEVSDEYRELYEIELETIREFLSGQYHHDPLFQKIIRIVS